MAWSVQVKTNTGRTPFWLLNERAKTTASPNHIYVFVTIEGKSGPELLPVKSEFVASHMCEERSSNGSSFYSFERRSLQPDSSGWWIFDTGDGTSSK